MKRWFFRISTALPLYMLRNCSRSTETWMLSFFSATGKTIFK